MIWPWKRIHQLELENANLRASEANRMKWEAQWKAIALTYSKELLGAHKGIRRLKDKLKQARQKEAS